MRHTACRVVLPLLLVAAALAAHAAPAEAKRSCGTARAFDNAFRVSTYGGTTCRLALSVVRRYDVISREQRCGSYMTTGPCNARGYRCATSGYNSFTCRKRDRRIVARLA